MIQTIVVSIVASTGFWTFLNAIIQNKQKSKSVNRKALLALLHDKLYTTAEEIIRNGTVTVDQLDNLNYLITPYFDMGGNGLCKRLYEEVLKLPIKKE